jgi:ABC-type multidrug transport system ATPase subunit/pSer/pThr/pTyr-binding forkhead associated (FHA) protein
VSDTRVAGNERSEAQLIPRLLMLSGSQRGREYRLTDRVTTIGRGINNDIVISDPQTSRRHLEIVRENGIYTALDSGSANGFYVNETQTKRATLKDGDVITIGLVQMAYRTTAGAAPVQAPAATQGAPELPPTAMLQSGAVPQVIPPPGSPVTATPRVYDERSLEQIDLKVRQLTSLGREHTSNDVVLDNPQVSRRHAQIINQGGNFTVSDLRSTNGTYVNGNRISTPTVLNDGDLMNIGPYRFMFSQGFLYRSQDDDSVRIDVLNLSKQISSKLTLLHNCTFTILPREFVAIVGGSGTGKTTLLDAVSGVRPANGGAVLYNRSNYYEQMEVYRTTIGYVPQDDIVPAELTVYKALYYAARLRLPQDTSDAEMEERLEDVMDDLGLTQRKDTPIHLLSGGQRKRVSIAAELISKPSLFFLDEPTSGLDPGLEGRMMQLLRKLADQGRTVILITHATQNVELCDRVLFLAKGGYVAFYGRPRDALDYFGVTRFADIYNKLEQERTPEEWAQLFQKSTFYDRNVLSRLRAVAAEANKYGINVETNPMNITGMVSQVMDIMPRILFRTAKTRVSPLSQFLILTRRYLDTIIADRRSLITLLLQAPIIALLLALVFRGADWDPQTGDFGSARSLVFMMTIVAVWFGTNNAAREIVKETSIYKRERRIGLKIAPYVFSKLVVQFGLVVLQTIALVLILWLFVGFNKPTLEYILYIFLTLLLTALAGATMGLMVSALSKNSDRANYFVPMLLIPQIIFSGAVVALEKMGVVGNFISSIMVARWGYEASGSLTGLDNLPSPRVKFTGPPPEFAADLERLFRGSLKYESPDWYLIPSRNVEFDGSVYLRWGIIGLIILVSVSLVFFFQLRKDRDYTK